LAAAKELGSWLHMNLPDNYDFDVKERGVMLSSGQRQLILESLCEQPEFLF
jgi:ABC-type multidrug transport system fused ATPase/permease subunit